MPDDTETLAASEPQQPHDDKPPAPNQPQGASAPDQGQRSTPVSNNMEKIEAHGSFVAQAERIIVNNIWAGDVRSQANAIRQGGMPGILMPELLRNYPGVAEGFAAAAEATILPGADYADDSASGASDTAQRAEHLPDTEEEIAHWYCDTLQEGEQRFVQAVAVFHGAPMHLVTKAAGELYIPVRERRRRDEGGRRFRMDDLPRSTHELLARTHTTRRIVGGAHRVFWVDVERSGYSAFGLKVLRFIADEAEGVSSLTGQSVLSILEKWAVRGDGELTWRAAYALGAIWWRLDQSQLRQTARRWATDKDAREQQSAAGLLAGAYETERNETDAESFDSSKSVISRLLRQWTDETLHADDTETNEIDARIRLTSAITSSFGLIGRKWPEAGLDGLDYLMELGGGQTKADYISLPPANFVFGAMSYITLAWSGLVREVIKRLAGHLERIAHQPRSILATSEMAQARRRRDEGLAVLFFVFFFVVVASLAGDDEDTATPYSQDYKLPPRPVIPDTHSKDVLLAAILAEEEDQIRDNLTTILCAAIAQSRAELAFDVMRSWAEIVLRQTGPQAEALRSAYLGFVVGIGERVRQWDREPEDREPGRVGRQANMSTFHHRIRIWATTRSPLGEAPMESARAKRERTSKEALAAFAKDVQAQFGA